MTKFLFKKDGEDFVRIECKGHTGYAESGADVVCAGLSTAVQGAVLGIMKVANVNAGYSVDERSGHLVLTIPQGISESKRHDCNVILRTLYLIVKDLQKSYSEFIEVEVN